MVPLKHAPESSELAQGQVPLDGAARAKVEAHEALYITLGLLALLGVGKPLAPMLNMGADFLYLAVAGYQLYVPLWLIQRRQENPESHGIHLHGLLLGPIAALRKCVLTRMRRAKTSGRRSFRRVLRYYGRGARLDRAGLYQDLGWAIVLACITFPPFFVAHHFFRLYVFGPEYASYTFRLPPNLMELVVVNVLLIGLPEELFYRGFLQTRLERWWTNRRSIFGIPCDRTVIVVSALFALGHFLGEWNPARLGPFFPAFLFSMLRRKSGSITGAILYHGLSNVFSATLLYGYQT